MQDVVKPQSGDWGEVEFRFGDRVRWLIAEDDNTLGTVVNECHQNTIMGNFDACLPLPVAVLFDEPGEVWWTPGTELEMA